MLCAGLVHGDLSEFNILVGSDGPVIIDLPQAVDAAANNHALGMLERDVANVTGYLGRFAPELLDTRFGEEIRALFEAGELHPEAALSGRFERAAAPVDLDAVLLEIESVRAEALRREERLAEHDSAT
jgi:RIO kinase 1